MLGSESSIRGPGLPRSRHHRQTEPNTEGTEYTESGEEVKGPTLFQQREKDGPPGLTSRCPRDTP
jgi:hypothetical protein